MSIIIKRVLVSSGAASLARGIGRFVYCCRSSFPLTHPHPAIVHICTYTVYSIYIIYIHTHSYIGFLKTDYLRVREQHLRTRIITLETGYV